MPPPIQFSTDWDITHNDKHWSNESTMIRYIENVIVPFVTRVRNDLGVGQEQAALAIFDSFRGQITEKVFILLNKHNMQSVVVPPNCTDKLQPLDLTVNKVAKSFLQKQFIDWYATEIPKQLDADSDSTCPTPVDLSTARMKCVGATWLIRMYEHLTNNPHHMVNGFRAAGIPQSIDAGKPITVEGANNDDDDDGGGYDTDMSDGDDEDDVSDSNDTDSNIDDTSSNDKSEGIDLEYDTDEAIMLYEAQIDYDTIIQS